MFHLTSLRLPNYGRGVIDTWKTHRPSQIGVICAIFAFVYPHEAFAGKGKVTPPGPNDPIGAEAMVEAFVHVAYPPTQGDIDDMSEKLRRAARMICDATDGQVLINNIYLERNGLSANNADVIWYPEGYITRFIASRNGNHYGHAEAEFRVADQVAFRAIAHEFGHLLLGLGDQYDRQRRGGTTGCGQGPSLQESVMTSSNHSIMQKYDTYCADGMGNETLTKCNYDIDCAGGEVCYEFSELASEFNTATHFETVLDNGDDWPGVQSGEMLWLDARLYSGLSGTIRSANRGIEYIDRLGDLSLLTDAHKIWLKTSKVATNEYELKAFMGPEHDECQPLLWEIDSISTDTLRLKFNGASGCGVDASLSDYTLTTIDPDGVGGVSPIAPPWDVLLHIPESILDVDYGIGNVNVYSLGDAILNVDFENVCERDDPFTDDFEHIDVEIDQDTGRWVKGSYIGQSPTNMPLQAAYPDEPVFQQLALCAPTTLADPEEVWNGLTQRWEVSDQYRTYGDLSDWELIEDNFNGGWASLPNSTFPPLNISTPSPVVASPATSNCDNFEPTIDDSKVDAVESVVMLIDRSKSMAEEWQNDGGGATQPKIKWALAGAYGFALAGQGNPGATPPTPSKDLWLRVAGFNQDIFLMEEFGELTPDPGVGEVDALQVKTFIDGLNPGGFTAIGDAVITAVNELFVDPSAANAVFLFTDGESTTGASIATASAAAVAAQIPVFVSPVGTFDASTLDPLASETGGEILPTVEADEIPATMFLMRAKVRGEDLSLLYETSALSKSSVLPDDVDYDILVEPGAERLVLLLSSSAEYLSTWEVDFELTGPASESITPASVDHVTFDEDGYFYLITVNAPSAGTWNMALEAPVGIGAPKTNPEKQLLMAHVEHEGPRCKVTTSVKQIDDDSEEVTVYAKADWGGLVGEDAEFFGEVRHPDGSTSAFSLDAAVDGTAVGTFDGYSTDGPYLVKVKCVVGANAIYARGDEDPELPDEVVPNAFERTGMSYFVLDDGIPMPLGSAPCSAVGTDTDGDGVPNACDMDIDGDDLPNSLEGGGDTDGDGTADAYDRDSDDDGEADGDDSDAVDPVAHRRYTVGDFNGDGAEDRAWGEPTYNSSAGRVAVKYAGEDTIEYWRQGYNGILDSSEAGDFFGAAIVAGDFDNNGWDDLAIGAPGESYALLTDAGAFHIIYGSAGGLTGSGDQYWDEESSGVFGTGESDDQLGSRLTVGDFDCNGYLDLVIASPDEAIGAATDAGAVHVLYGTSGGISSVDNEIRFQGDSGVNDTSETGDRFGDEVVAGDFDGDTCDDLVVGVPSEDITPDSNAGNAYLIYGTNVGLHSSGDWTLVQGVLQETVDANDEFSTRMWVESINDDAYDDLVIMSPNDCGGNGAKGFNYVFGSSGGLTTTDNVWYCREEK
jgi:FG-GAP repeat